ncbi:MAG: 3-phosphoshikimate 1-carboxyvinyltransferase [bacterium]|jgi:3-phosphoshikimate 1-carboxyvinyltransferase|nr:3-phosphoshikimate 1-carboxyvinyltransferase [bacterium]
MSSEDHIYEGCCKIGPGGALRGTIRVPGDKSISHRAIMLSAIAQGESVIRGFLESEDCLATLKIFTQMGIDFSQEGDVLRIYGRGLSGLREPDHFLDMGNSGTGARLMMGILAGQPFATFLIGDSSLRKRPMGRVTEPLSRMGARFIGRENGTKLPLAIQGGHLKGISYQSPVASAQVKSALLLAGLYAQGVTTLVEPGPSRDHTERMLKTFGYPIETEERSCTVSGPCGDVQGLKLDVPGDFSSAAFFMVAASILPGSDLLIESVGINPTRTGLLDVLQEMGADLTLENQRMSGAEPVADIRVRSHELHGTTIGGETVVRMIDEFPIFAVAAAKATTPSIVKEAEELRVKESDRIAVIVRVLRRMGVTIEEMPDGFAVQGNSELTGSSCASFGDHRIAMSLAIAGLAARGETVIQGIASVSTSFPHFFSLLETISPGSVIELA